MQLDEAELAAIPEGTLLVNTARAALVDREELPADDSLRGTETVQLAPHLAGDGPVHAWGRPWSTRRATRPGRGAPARDAREQADPMAR